MATITIEAEVPTQMDKGTFNAVSKFSKFTHEQKGCTLEHKKGEICTSVNVALDEIKANPSTVYDILKDFALLSSPEHVSAKSSHRCSDQCYRTYRRFRCYEECMNPIVNTSKSY